LGDARCAKPDVFATPSQAIPMILNIALPMGVEVSSASCELTKSIPRVQNSASLLKENNVRTGFLEHETYFLLRNELSARRPSSWLDSIPARLLANSGREKRKTTMAEHFRSSVKCWNGSAWQIKSGTAGFQTAPTYSSGW
jgi:hypothetical protein